MRRAEKYIFIYYNAFNLFVNPYGKSSKFLISGAVYRSALSVVYPQCVGFSLFVKEVYSGRLKAVVRWT